MESVRPWELCTDLEILIVGLQIILENLRNIISGIWAVAYIKMLSLLKFSIYAHGRLFCDHVYPHLAKSLVPLLAK